MKKAYIFPGQGSQYPGMGRRLYEADSRARELMDGAAGIMGFDICSVMFDGSDEDLRSTRVTQPAIYIHSAAMALCGGLEAPQMVAGHSLGEFSALACAGVFSFEDGLKLVKLRASLMQACCEKSAGTMAAVIGMDAESIREICEKESGGKVVVANLNSPAQTVISGETSAMDAVCTALKAAGARRALKLNVSGAFHSPLMEPAREELAKAIACTAFSKPACPVWQNVSACAETDPGRIRENLLLQLTSPVRWTETMTGMIADGATEFTEVGPGSVLQGLLQRTAAHIGAEVTINGIETIN